MEDISFSFERRQSEPPAGFELGDLTVATSRGTATSKARTPDAGMMIYLALTDLMTGIGALLTGAKRRFEFVGADSSFVLVFARTKRGIEVKHGKIDLGTVDPTLLAQRLLAEANRFLQAHPLERTDSVFDDLGRSRKTLQDLVGHH